MLKYLVRRGNPRTFSDTVSKSAMEKLVIGFKHSMAPRHPYTCIGAYLSINIANSSRDASTCRFCINVWSVAFERVVVFHVKPIVCLTRTRDDQNDDFHLVQNDGLSMSTIASESTRSQANHETGAYVISRALPVEEGKRGTRASRMGRYEHL